MGAVDKRGANMMRTMLVMMTIAACLVVAPASGQTTKRKPKPPKAGQRQPPTALFLAELEVGQVGFLTFADAKTLLPLQVGAVEEGQFIGLLNSKAKVIVRGVVTDGLVSDRYFQLEGAVKVTGTEKISNGASVFVLEPVDPSTFKLKRSEMPSLVMPR